MNRTIEIGRDVFKRPHLKTAYTDQDAEDLARCLTDPLFFMRTFMRVQHPIKGAVSFEPYECQERIIRGIHEHRFSVILTARQMGKCLKIETPLPTPTGWTTMGDVKVGDDLIDINGLPTKVTFATDVMYDHECYNIEFDSGETITADADHLWKIGTGLYYHHPERREVLTTREILGLLVKAKETRQPIFIDMPAPIVGYEEKLPVPPYTLGVWLGDGSHSNGNFCGHLSDNLEMRAGIMADGFIMSPTRPDSRKPEVVSQTIYGLQPQLRKAGVFKNKHIPAQYLRSSVAQRLELLQGLMDTDGSSEKWGLCEITQKHKILADSIFELLYSLGIKARQTIKVVKGTPYHRIRFSTVDFEVFRLGRKMLRQKKTQGHTQLKRIFIKSITKTASVPVRCIQVDNPDHLFLCGRSMIPTHNTTCAAGYLLWRAMFVPDTQVLVTANLYAQALEIMTRIRYAYESLPDHIRAGAIEYNKGSLGFDNGSRITARATSENAGRGLSITLLYADELSFIQPSKQKSFWTSIQPVLSEGGSCIITSTPKNDEDQFAQIWKGACDNVDDFGNTIRDGVGRNGFFPVRAPWWEHPERDEAWAEPFRQTLGKAKFLQEFCCSFVSDDDTLINPLTLPRLRDKDPAFYTGTIRWYVEPEPNKTYLVSLDPSLGTKEDYAAIEVFQMPEMIQVAEWQSNEAAPRRQVAMLMEVMYALDSFLRDNPNQMTDPEIFWTFENNTIGEAILTIVEDTGEERFPGALVTERRRKGISMKRVRKGLNTTNRSRLSSLARMKSLIESDRMTIYSQNLIRELKNFVAIGNTFKAKSGEHDDLVMATSLAIRMIDIVLSWETSVDNNSLREYIEDTEFGDLIEEPMPVLV